MDGAIKRSRNLRISKIIASKVLGEDIIIFLEFYIFEDSFEITISFRTKKKSVEKIFNSFSNSRFKNLPPPPLSPILHPFASLHRTSQSGRDSIRFRPGINQLLAPSPASIFTGRKKGGGARRGISALFAFIIPCDAFNRVPLNRRRQNTVSPPFSLLPPPLPLFCGGFAQRFPRLIHF